jgi:3-methylcrotonyl-CoA carboxylase alpha subunit
LRVAAGEGLPLSQQALSITGHAFEARLYAEDVPAGFLPATGRLDHLRFSGAARCDTGVRTGDQISPWYDPMIAKIVTHGPTRAVALKRLEAALAATEVAGTVTNLAFLGALTRHQGFRAGDVDTGLIARDIDALSHVAGAEVWQIAAAAALAIDLPQLTDPLAGFTLGGLIWQDVALEGVDTLRIAVTGPMRAQVQVNGQEVSVQADDGALRVEGAPELVRGICASGRITLFGAAPQLFTLRDPLMRDRAMDVGADVVLAPMPGLVKAVFVAAGDRVERGARLAILEAMKMEHTLTAARDGVISEVLTQTGAQVEAGAALVRLEDGP